MADAMIDYEGSRTQFPGNTKAQRRRAVFIFENTTLYERANDCMRVLGDGHEPTQLRKHYLHCLNGGEEHMV